ncbi:MAG TPA: ATP-binding protein [Thermoanaerobaculia bacterium]
MLHDPNAESLFPRLTEEALRHLREEGEEIELEPGAVLFSEGDQNYQFFVILDGEVRITKQIGGEEAPLALHVPGEFTGEISMLTGGPAIATGRAVGRARVLRIDPDKFRRLVAECPPVARVVLSAMAARANDVDAQLRQDEKMAALGKMAAGLAHELNNPASAAQRSAGQLRESIRCLQTLVLERERPFTADERRVLGELQSKALAALAQRENGGPALDPMAQSDLEDAVTEWLEERGAEEAWNHAPVLAAAGVGPDRLDAFAADIGEEALVSLLPWIEGILNLAELLDQIENSTTRISELVTAVKEYSYMDQAPEQEIDLHDGLESTLTMLGHKLRKGNVEVVREYDRTLPRVCAHGSELNQVWTNLIDNAVDAMKDIGGTLTLRTSRFKDNVLVEVMDTGPGIPKDAQRRIFEPFFTTKSVGEGTGLGLDIARRIVTRRHNGEIRFESQPGKTLFEVWLPIPCGGDVTAEEIAAAERGE